MLNSGSRVRSNDSRTEGSASRFSTRSFLAKPLTVFEAEAEARWRWGGLLAQGIARYSSGARLPFEVGEKQRFGPIKIRGRGKSWEAAFSNADVLTNQESSKKPADKRE